MKYKIEFTFGVGEDAAGNAITVQRRIDAMREIQRVAVELFGGYTLSKTEGGWRNPQGRLVEEPGHCLSILSDGSCVGYDLDTSDPIKRLAEVIKQQLAQECVAVCVIECNWDFL